MISCIGSYMVVYVPEITFSWDTLIVTLIAAAGYDLCNAYNNGYNDVKSTTPPNPNNVSVSCGDSVY